MAWTTTQDLDEFEGTAGAFLRAWPAEHTVLLSVTAALRAVGTDAFGADAPWFGWWRRDGETSAVEGAFLWTPPRPVLLSPMAHDAAVQLAEALGRQRLAVPGVNGRRAVAEAVAAAWQRRRGGTVKTVEHHRLYRLGALTPPRPAPPGAGRVATTADRDLVLAWLAAFAEDVGEPRPPDARITDDRIARGLCTLWETGGRPVSLAAVTRTLSGMARVATVYTPPDLRGRGYAGAATAAVSRAAQASGAAEVLLFADVGNSTSNALYRRLGFRAVEDHVALEFGYP